MDLRCACTYFPQLFHNTGVTIFPGLAEKLERNMPLLWRGPSQRRKFPVETAHIRMQRLHSFFVQSNSSKKPHVFTVEQSQADESVGGAQSTAGYLSRPTMFRQCALSVRG